MVRSVVECACPWASALGGACSLLPSLLHHDHPPDLPHLVGICSHSPTHPIWHSGRDNTFKSTGDLNLKEVSVVPCGPHECLGHRDAASLPCGSLAPLFLCLPGVLLNSDSLIEARPKSVARDSSWGAAWESYRGQPPGSPPPALNHGSALNKACVTLDTGD